MAEKKFVSDNFELMIEWNWEKNGGLLPSDVTCGSHKKVWWKCDKGHEWEATVSSRNSGCGCPYCYGRFAIKGQNDLQTVNTALSKEWNYEKNNGLTPVDVLPNSKKKVWWKCSKGHEWQAMIGSRNKGHGCPYCSGQKVIKNYNDLQTVNPILAEEWNYEKNNNLKPENFTANSGQKVWWKCSEGHEWQAAIVSRNSGRGCPYCTGRKVLKGYNDLQTVSPTLAKEWNYEKNNGLTPWDVLPNSNKKVWWKCKKGHEWQAMIISRKGKGSGCPYCYGRYAIKGQNDLQTVSPTLSEEWDYEKNNGLTPADVLPNSQKKVWWKCQKGHEWQATIGSRNDGCGCPVCNAERKTSFPEYVLVYYLKKYGLETVHSYNKKGYELDVYIPSQKTAIEYDGYFWHKKRRKEDLKKNLKCKNAGIKLYRIREGLSPLNDSSIDYVIQNQKDLPQIFKEVLSDIIGTNVDIDLKRDAIAIENLRVYTEKENSLLFSKPEIAKEWNYKRNGNLKPENFTVNSNKRVWWQCSKGHEWQAIISNRSKGNSCPYCVGRKVLKGYNDLKTINPTLSEEWNHQKNNGLTPADVLPNSNKKVWWKCSEGHEWQAIIASRNKGHGCPVCKGVKVGMRCRKSHNTFEMELKAINPNIELVGTYATQKQRIKCRCLLCENEWEALPSNLLKGSRCPVCARKRKK